MNPIFENGVSYSPTLAVYNIGDSVRITHTFKNKFETHATTHTFTRIFIYVNDELRSTSEYLSHGNVFPDATITHITDLSFDSSYVGQVRISSDVYFSLLGEEYDYSGRTATLTVASPEPDIDFTATLYATPAEIEAGETVAFNINLENRGSDTIDYFEIRNSEGGLLITTGSFAPGDSRPAGILSAIHETSDISYVVIGYADGYSVSRETNTVHITVTEPTETPAPTETPTPTPSPTAAPSPEETAEAAPSIEASPSQAPSETMDTPAPSDDATAAPGEESTNEETNLGFGLFILIALAVLIVAAIIILSVILIKRRKSDKVKDSDFE
jgi:hypothetical protein